MQEYTNGTIAIFSGASALFGAAAAFLTAWIKGKNSLNEQIDKRVLLILDQKDRTIEDRDRTIADQKRSIAERDETIEEMRQTIKGLTARVECLERRERERSEPEIVDDAIPGDGNFFN